MSGIALPRSDATEPRLVWSGRWSVTSRILAVNIFALALLAGGFFYLDSYRARLIDERLDQFALTTRLIATSLETSAAGRQGLPTFDRLAAQTGFRLRLYPAVSGSAPLDSWDRASPTYSLRDPSTQGWNRRAARFLDRVVGFVAGAKPLDDYVEDTHPLRRAVLPEVVEARRSDQPVSRVRLAPDLTPILSAAVRTSDGAVLLATNNDRDITRTVRAERLRLGMVLAVVITVSVLISLFLARTIARPLRRLAIAAQRVRLGRAREVQVPRLPSRRDEIGMLARALSDMTQTLRQRIDATEAFAADVTHELKNPLASLRSAVESFGMVKDPALQEQLVAVIRDDVRRLDRLITDIAEASRIDAELSRASFDRIDLGVMIEGLVTAREARGLNGNVRVAFARPHVGSAVVMGDGSRLARLIENLVDNAVSFSPAGGLVEIAATRDGAEVLCRVEDEGPGVVPEAREAIFTRFHSIRPDGEAFGKHSGLGLAIAKAIVEAHHGSITVENRDDAPSGARFVIRLPTADT
ncbi:MAG: signal transduction histidine kinase [Sphingomonas bacterium]|nr:ATP-binding protein [Sphingomonas bacterium]MDB5689695.1 signal transduction histidine kinase [Sphingomonas bacterium]